MRAGVEIIARPRRTIQNGSRVPGSPIDEIEIGIIGSRHPRHAASRSGSEFPAGGVEFHCHWVAPVSGSIDRI